ncbi:MAG: hypothetical protein RR405_04285 [Clostridia bacterium]
MFQNYKNYGKCARFESNGIIALVTLDIGPRIIYFGTEDLNFLNEDLDRNVSKGGEYFDKNFKAGEKWYLYGGHRVWKSPEDLESYTTDNYAVEYTLRERGGSFTTRIAKKLDYTLDIEMNENGELTIKNIITNKDDTARTLSVWALTVAAKGGMLIVPLNDAHDDLNPSQNLVQWPYNELDDERITLTHSHLTVRQTEKPNALKLGIFSEKNVAYYVLKNKALKFEFTPQTGEYGDFCCNFETYTNCHILEVEGLSAKKTISKGESAMLEEKWSIIGC